MERSDERLLTKFTHNRPKNKLTHPQIPHPQPPLIPPHRFATAFLYQFSGIDTNKPMEELLMDKLFFGVMSALFASPLGVVLTLLYKKCGERKYMEDLFLDLDLASVPEGMKEEVKDRKMVKGAERDFFIARANLKNTKEGLKKELTANILAGLSEGRKNLKAADKLHFRREFETKLDLCKKALQESKVALGDVVKTARLHEKDRKVAMSKVSERSERALMKTIIRASEQSEAS